MKMTAMGGLESGESTCLDEGIRSRITVAEQTVREMEHLLMRRKYAKITRVKFLAEWGQLRARLSKTNEYKRLRQAVIARSRGKCMTAGCGRRGEVMHHLEPVAMNPRRALDKKNVAWLCSWCHAAIHPHLRKPRNG